MSVDTMAAFTEQRRKVHDIMPPFKMHNIPQPQEMPKRYESEEEEISEYEHPNAEDNFYSPVDSEISAVDFDNSGRNSDNHYNSYNNNSNHNHNNTSCSSTSSPQRDFAFRLPSPAPDPDTPETPVFNKRRGSCLTLMAPKSPLHKNNDQPLRGSYGPYRDSPSFQKAKFFSSMLLETVEGERTPVRHSICSEILSSDDEFGPEIHFSIATSIAYRVPESKPSIVSVGPTRSVSSTPPVPEQEKKRPAPLDLESPRRLSSATNRMSGSVKNRLTRLMSSKQEKRRGSYFAQFPNMSHSNILESPTFKTPNWNPTEDESRGLPSPNCEKQLESRRNDKGTSGSNRPSNSLTHQHSQDKTSRDFPSQGKGQAPSPALTRSNGIRRRVTNDGEISPLPSDSRSIKGSPASQQKKRFVYSLTPPTTQFSRPKKTNTSPPNLSSSNLADTESLRPRSSSSRANKAYSIRSVASNSSKLSLSPFESSFKNLTRRYSRSPTRESLSGPRRPSGSLLSPRHAFGFQDTRESSDFGLGLARTHTLAVGEERYLSSQVELPRQPAKDDSPRKHKYSTSKSMKWLDSSKALGSMIRTKMT